MIVKIKTNNSIQLKSKDFIKKLFISDKASLIGALLVMIIVFSSLTPNFFTSRNFLNIFIAASLIGLVAVGESYLVIAGQVDLSPGSVAAFCGVLASILVAKGFGTFLTLIIVIVAGLVIGYLNSLAVNSLKIEPFIATLASMSIFRGFAYILCDGKPVFIKDPTFLKLGVGMVLGIPIPVVILLITFLIFGVVLAKTRFGRNIYIVGGNPTAARLAGINPNSIKTKLYMINAGLAALGGAILASRMNSGQPSASNGLEFDAITAAILGGIAFTGGIGTLTGTLIGVIILQGFNNGLLLLNVQSFWQYVARGLLLIVALSFDYFRSKNRK